MLKAGQVWKLQNGKTLIVATGLKHRGVVYQYVGFVIDGLDNEEILRRRNLMERVEEVRWHLVGISVNDAVYYTKNGHTCSKEGHLPVFLEQKSYGWKPKKTTPKTFKIDSLYGNP